jgi:two-component system, LuxR family, sensor kinase FixL
MNLSWITVVWSMIVAACLTLGLVHLAIWSRQTRQIAHLAFFLIAVSVAGVAVSDLLLMRAQTPAEFGVLLRWRHVPILAVMVSMVVFVLLYLRAGRLWLACLVCSLRLLAVILNFYLEPNLNYQEITGLRQLQLFGGETASAAIGVARPMLMIGELSVVLLLLFVVDASITCWRRGDSIDRRRAASVGGSFAFMATVAITNAALIHAGMIQSIYLLSLAFLAVVAATSYELSGFDITESKNAEERFRLALEAAPNAMIMVNAVGRITLANAQVEAVFGYPCQELMGLPIERLIPERLRARHSGDPNYFVDPAPRAMGAGRELFGLRKDGSEVPVEIGINPIETSDGPMVLASIVDITARKRAELEIEQQRNELAHLSRVTMLGELSGSLAHELNQPLTAILSNAQAAQRFLAHDDVDLDEVRAILQDIVNDDKRAGEIIRGLRLLLKKGEMQSQPLDLNDVVRDVLKLMRSDMLNGGIIVSTELAPGSPMVNGDQVQLQQVLLNLVVNAGEAMAGVAATERRLIVRTALAEGEGIRVSIADQGHGIALENLERMFEPFFTTKAHGLGLGLAVCRSIIIAHGGRLWATRNAGRGASFHFALAVSS